MQNDNQPGIGTTKRAISGFLILVGFFLYFGLSSMRSAFLDYRTNRKAGKDHITEYEKRFDGIRPHLPRNGTVGFITDLSLPVGGEDWSFAYMLTQYTLPPLVVVGHPNLPLVVGVFNLEIPEPGKLAESGLVPIRYYGNGVILFKKEQH